MVTSLWGVCCHCIKFRRSFLQRVVLNLVKQKALIQIEGDERDEEVPHSDDVMKHIIAVDADKEDNWGLQDIPPSGAIDVQFGCCDDLSIIQEKCRLYGLKIAVNTGGVFCTAMQGLDTVSELFDALERLVEAQASVQELEVEVKLLCGANVVGTSSRKVVACLGRELVDAQVQRKCNLTILQTRADAEWDMLHAVVRDRNLLQLLLDAKQQKH